MFSNRESGFSELGLPYVAMGSRNRKSIKGMFCELVEHTSYIYATRRRGRLRVAISTAPDLSGSGRVDMLTCPVAAARAAVATGASG